MAEDQLDFKDRDVNNINAHLGTLHFNEVFGEPDGTHSFEIIWRCSYICFNFWKSFCYKLATCCFGVCIAMEYGCEFASVAFYHIWLITPCLKIFQIQCGTCQRLYGYCISCAISPLCEACGGVFIHFKREG